eukprot:gb/GECG01013312.1/.p1 GENE.gb/GECG01013312.1/~~gb/GECG01013312.1/.p1  ORF type:complete len:571 (+),score=65.00 gb/GECG01013312.1/:1-1713(+)
MGCLHEILEAMPSTKVSNLLSTLQSCVQAIDRQTSNGSARATTSCSLKKSRTSGHKRAEVPASLSPKSPKVVGFELDQDSPEQFRNNYWLGNRRHTREHQQAAGSERANCLQDVEESTANTPVSPQWRKESKKQQLQYVANEPIRKLLGFPKPNGCGDWSGLTGGFERRQKHIRSKSCFDSSIDKKQTTLSVPPLSTTERRSISNVQSNSRNFKSRGRTHAVAMDKHRRKRFTFPVKLSRRPRTSQNSSAAQTVSRDAPSVAKTTKRALADDDHNAKQNTRDEQAGGKKLPEHTELDQSVTESAVHRVNESHSNGQSSLKEIDLGSVVVNSTGTSGLLSTTADKVFSATSQIQPSENLNDSEANAVSDSETLGGGNRGIAIPEQGSEAASDEVALPNNAIFHEDLKFCVQTPYVPPQENVEMKAPKRRGRDPHGSGDLEPNTPCQHPGLPMPHLGNVDCAPKEPSELEQGHFTPQRSRPWSLSFLSLGSCSRERTYQNKKLSSELLSAYDRKESLQKHFGQESSYSQQRDGRTQLLQDISNQKNSREIPDTPSLEGTNYSRSEPSDSTTV